MKKKYLQMRVHLNLVFPYSFPCYLSEKVKIINLLLHVLVCSITAYNIDRSVLLENTPLIKFI